MVLSGDSPHYLVAVNSLIEDGDFDLKNNYEQALAGDWDMGARFRSVPVDRHVDIDLKGRQYGTHSPFFPVIMALPAMFVAGSGWVESICIWMTMLAGLTGVMLFARWLNQVGFIFRNTRTEFWVSLLGLATPLLCYSRDLWTEPWILAIWVGMLVTSSPAVLSMLAFAGILIKYPFFIVSLTMGLLAVRKGDRRRGAFLCGSSLAGILTVFVTIQWLFRDVDHFSLFHSGVHGSFGLPFEGALGLLLNPRSGLLLFFPFFAWGLVQFRKGGNVYVPATAFFLFHAAYEDWSAGTGFSARYLVPMLPILVMAVRNSGTPGKLFLLAVVYSVFWGCFGGFFPALVYDRAPWEVFAHIWRNL
jgi:hypothetical protein